MQVNVSAAPAVFNFAPGLTLRVFDSEGNPWFPATDIEKMFDLSNIRKRVAGLDEDERATIKSETGGTLTIVNESGLWTLVLRSDAALKKDTVAYKARKWVTSEVLPAIRSSGRYECPVAATQTIDAAQQLAVKKAVARRAKNVAVHYQTLYRALYDRFQIPRYTELFRSDFDDAIRFIETCEIRPQIETAPSIPEDAVIFTRFEAERIRGLVYGVKYLYRPELNAFLQLLQLVNSPLAPRFWELVNDLGISLLEKTLEKHGLAVTDLDCFKALPAR